MQAAEVVAILTSTPRGVDVGTTGARSYRPAFQLKTWDQAVRFAGWLVREHGRYNPGWKVRVVKQRPPGKVPWLVGWSPMGVPSVIDKEARA